MLHINEAVKINTLLEFEIEYYSHSNTAAIYTSINVLYVLYYISQISKKSTLTGYTTKIVQFAISQMNLWNLLAMFNILSVNMQCMQCISLLLYNNAPWKLLKSSENPIYKL